MTTTKKAGMSFVAKSGIGAPMIADSPKVSENGGKTEDRSRLSVMNHLY